MTEIKRILLIILLILVFNVQVMAKSLNLIHISDVHLDMNIEDNPRFSRLYSYSQEILKKAVKQINTNENSDLIIFSGDMINSPRRKKLDRFIEITNQLKKPWYWVFGNHDIAISGDLTKKKYLAVLNESNEYIKPEKPYYSFFPDKDIKIIVLDGVIDDRITANGKFSRKQLDWLKEELNDPNIKLFIITCHFPVLEPFKSKSHRILNQQDLLNVLTDSDKKILYLSGHYHATKVKMYKNVINVSTPALVEYPLSYRRLNIDIGDKIKITSRLIPVKIENLQALSKERSSSYLLNYGEEHDRNFTIILD